MIDGMLKMKIALRDIRFGLCELFPDEQHKWMNAESEEIAERVTALLQALEVLIDYVRTK